MRIHRIYYPFHAKIHENITIKDDKAHYLKNVLRVKIEQNIRIFNNNSEEYLATITSINKKHLTLNLHEKIKTIEQSKLNIRLIQSLSKGDRMDYTVQKATELGISTILPITSDYCEVKLKGARLMKKIKHWQAIATSASEQSFRADIPEILMPISIDEYTQTQHKGLLLEPNEEQTLTNIAQDKWQSFDIVIGPEGGWSAADIQLLKSAGLTGIQFGQRILRTETMAPAVLAAIHSLWGDFI